MQGQKPKSKEHNRKTSLRGKINESKDDSNEKISSAITGNHLRTLTDHRTFAGSMLKVPRRNSRDHDKKHSELKHMLQKKPSIAGLEDKIPTLNSKLFSRIKQSKLISMTNASNLDKSYGNRSASKELISKIKNLFGTKSNEKSTVKFKKSRDKKKVSKDSLDDNAWKRKRGLSNGKSREISRESKSSLHSHQSLEKTKNAQLRLSKFYERLCLVVDSKEESHDEKISSISRMFVDYTRLLESIDQDCRTSYSKQEKELKNKILGFFSFYSKMNTKAYLYTRKLVSDSLAHIEDFIVKERETMQQFTPQNFSSLDSVDMEEAVKILLNFTAAMVEQNHLLSGYVRKNLKKTETDEILLRRNKPSILKSLMPASQTYDGKFKSQSDSSMSNLEKENDLNLLYEISETQKGKTYYEMEEAASLMIKTYGKKYEDADHSKTPITSKLGYYNNQDADLCESNDYEYSETSKKKTINALGRKNSRVLEHKSKDKKDSSKDKRLIPPKNKRDNMPKRGLEAINKFDDSSIPNLIEYAENSKPKPPPTADLRLKLSQIKMH